MSAMLAAERLARLDAQRVRGSTLLVTIVAEAQQAAAWWQAHAAASGRLCLVASQATATAALHAWLEQQPSLRAMLMRFAATSAAITVDQLESRLASTPRQACRAWLEQVLANRAMVVGPSVVAADATSVRQPLPAGQAADVAALVSALLTIPAPQTWDLPTLLEALGRDADMNLTSARVLSTLCRAAGSQLPPAVLLSGDGSPASTARAAAMLVETTTLFVGWAISPDAWHAYSLSAGNDRAHAMATAGLILLSHAADAPLMRQVALESQTSQPPRMPVERRVQTVSSQATRAAVSADPPSANDATSPAEAPLSEPLMRGGSQRVRAALAHAAPPLVSAFERAFDQAVATVIENWPTREGNSTPKAFQEPEALQAQRARSRAEALLAATLAALPQTAGMFVLNQRLPIPFRRQADMEVDLHSRELLLAIEVDGYHHFLTADHFRRDRAKDLALQQAGFVVVRVLAEDVLGRLDDVVDTVVSAVLWRRARRDDRL